jgi:hypothetical protein
MKMIVRAILIAVAISFLGVPESQAILGLGPGVDCDRTVPPLTPIEECLCDAYGRFDWYGVGGFTALGAAGGALAGGVGAIVGGLGAGGAKFYDELKDLADRYEDCEDAE